jgi:hypothetical protein
MNRWPIAPLLLADALEQVQVERCRWLQAHPALVHSYTCFHWWPSSSDTPYKEFISDPLVVQTGVVGMVVLEEPLEPPRRLSWLLLRERASLTHQEQQMLAFILQERTIEVAYDLALYFGKMVRSRQQDQLDPWLEAPLGSGIPDLCTFAEGLKREYSALKAALTYPYSTGPVEGQINRLTFIKRSMYGWASFDFLRQRVLHH